MQASALDSASKDLCPTQAYTGRGFCSSCLRPSPYIRHLSRLLRTCPVVWGLFLHILCAVALDSLGKSPTLVLQLLIVAHFDALLGDHGQTVPIPAPRITVVQHLHAVPHNLDRFVLGQFGSVLLGGGVLAHDGLRKHGPEAGGQGRGRVDGTAQVSGRQEGLMGVVETSDEDLVPEGIEFVASSVEELGKVLVEVTRGQAIVATARVVSLGLRLLLVGGKIAIVGLVNLELVEVTVQELHVAHIAAEADDRGVGEGTDALDVVEAGQTAVRGQVVGGENDAIAELEAQDRGTRHGGGLGCRLGVGVVEVGMVVGAVNVVAGTAPGLWSVVHFGGLVSVRVKEGGGGGDRGMVGWIRRRKKDGVLVMAICRGRRQREERMMDGSNELSGWRVWLERRQ